MKKFLMLAMVVGSFILLGVDKGSAAPIEAYTKPAAQAAAVQTGDITGGRRSVRTYSYMPTPEMARGPVDQGRRSFSVEPGTVPTYGAPVMRRWTPARVPSYLLPKSDPRKYNGF